MGGRGSRGGGIAPGDSVTTNRTANKGGGAQVGGKTGGGGTGGGGGGGGGTKKTGSGGAGTGGVQTAGGGGGSGGGSVVEQPKDQQSQLTEDQIMAAFTQSEEWKKLADRNFATDEAYERAEKAAFAKWRLKNNFPEPAAAPAPTPPRPAPAPPLMPSDAPDIRINITGSVSERNKQKILSQTQKVPKFVRQILQDRGLKINVANRADGHPKWAAYAAATNTVSTDRVGDGRTVGDLSFYDPNTKDIFISVSKPGGSQNVMAHEMGHGVDDLWLNGETVQVDFEFEGEVFHYDVEEISRDDPFWVSLHDAYILNNPDINSYYRGGPSGSDAADGRSEFFAEGLAAYFQAGKPGLRAFLIEGLPDQITRNYVVNQMIDVWKRYGIIE